VRSVVDEGLFRAGVRVTNTGNAMVTPVAEFTLMQILRALRHASALGIGPAADGWSVLALRPGLELAGCPIGVVGAGQIGRRVIRLLRAFDATVRVYDPFLAAADVAGLGATQAGLEDLLRESRIVTLHAPAIPATARMIGPAQLAAMPDGAWLINTSRASLVDTDALVRELRTGRISAALDVFDREPLPDDSPLRPLPNALLSNHAAFLTRECLQRLGDITVAEVGRFVRGEPLQNEVTIGMLEKMA
jgi:phosphoglycerate dehydrogenase-like enzyme